MRIPIARLVAAVAILSPLASGINVQAGLPSAAPPTPKAAPAPVAFVAEKGLTVGETKDEATWDFGDRAGKNRIEHIFGVRNTGTAPITIESVLTSCHCTTAALIRPHAKAGEETDQITIPAGKSVSIRVSVDPVTAHAIDFRKMVWIYLKGRDEAALTLTVTGHLSAGPGDISD